MRSLMTALQSDRPLVVLDVEATGVNVEGDRVLQIGWIRAEPSEPYRVTRRELLVNPERPIPPEVIRVHGITDDQVAAEPPFRDVANELARELSGVDFVGYNFEFDRRMLEAEFARAGVGDPFRDARVIDPLRIWQVQEPRDLTSAMKRFGGLEPEVSHQALADAEQAARVLEGQLRHYPELEASVSLLHAMCDRRRDWLDSSGKIVWRDGAARINFGKYRGVALKDADPGFLDWMLGPERDFPEDVREIIRRARQGKYPAGPRG